MRFFHLSDLHIGKQLNERSLLEDQRYILSQVTDMIRQYGPDAVVIAGDIYDKSVPSAEAVTVFDEFLTHIASTDAAVLIISGNHDSAQRLDYGSRIFKKNGIYFAGMPPKNGDEHIHKVTITDEYGDVDFWLLPFVKPSYVRNIYNNSDIDTDMPDDSYAEAVRFLIDREAIDYTRRNVLVAHQLFTCFGKEIKRCDSEIISIGGIDNIDTAIIEGFDYAALGHIHGAQNVSSRVRYCGTLLKYSLSEQHDIKSLTLVDIKEKGSAPEITELPVTPMRDLRQITGTLDDILSQRNSEGICEDYVGIILTDESELYQPKERLMDYFPNLLSVRMDNSRTRQILGEQSEYEDGSSPMEIFNTFFEKIQGRGMTDEEMRVMQNIMKECDI